MRMASNARCSISNASRSRVGCRSTIAPGVTPARSNACCGRCFPRYLFVALDLEAERWRAILSTYGVAGMVGLSDGPVPVPDAVIEALRARAGDDGHFVVDAAKLKAGDPVRIESGPMRDLEGVFEATSDDERVIILLNLMGRGVRVTVPSDNIERA